MLWDGTVSRLDGLLLLAIFSGLAIKSIRDDRNSKADRFSEELEQELDANPIPANRAFLSVGIGLLVLVLSSRLLVWSAVEIATGFGVSDLIIGLTIVAIGTSLPELASSVIAARKGQHDIAFGNIIGSNLFNTLLVMGMAAVTRPLLAPAQLLTRDVALVAGLTVLLFAMSFGFRKVANIGRIKGAILLTIFVSYVAYLGSIATNT